ncbi:MAG TPA: type II secretion system protein [Candidatus Saccharibacteria bacterium]|nr:type II secretion system protein [Candidatus Saccharibacteria bacterium]HRK94526.1 type II secretion system protein [Candidatus Saccharibacteria bacterium]
MKQRMGFSLVEVLVIIGVLVLAGGLGFVAWKSFSKSAETTATGSPAVSTSKSAEVITTKADLEAAEKALDELDFEDEDASQAESQASL